MIKRVFVILVVCLSGFVSASHADELPDNLQARGRAETQLAGINLKQAKLADIVRQYGPPTSVRGVQEHDPKLAGSYDYYWIRAGLSVHVLVQRSSTDQPDGGYVSLIEVRAGTSRRIGRTGRGLRLGDSLKDLKRIYGSRYHLRDIPQHKIHDVALQWHNEEYSLVATLDRHNRITGLSLAAPE